MVIIINYLKFDKIKIDLNVAKTVTYLTFTMFYDFCLERIICWNIIHSRCVKVPV